MSRAGFDTDKYIRLQVQQIQEKLLLPGDKFYIEVGGKLIQDRHAARVLPGYREDARFEIAKELASEENVIVAVSMKDIVRGRIRGDFKITYDSETIRMIRELKNRGLAVTHAAITMLEQNAEPPESIINFEETLRENGVAPHRFFESNDCSAGIFNAEDYEKNTFVDIQSRHVIVIGPGGGSGKFGVCVSQLYHEMKRGKAPGFFSMGAFPLYDLPAKHPLNLAYMAASADLKDFLASDPDKANSILTEREIKNYKLLAALARHFGKEGKHLREIGSASDMCVSALSEGITDPEMVEGEAVAEIARRYMRYKFEVQRGEEKPETLERVRKIMAML